jgi:hypothetical protein
MAIQSPITLHPISMLKPGRSILDCSGPIHREWIREAVCERDLKVIVYRRSFLPREIDNLPIHQSLRMVSGELPEVLSRVHDTVNVLVDDLGAFHFDEHPLDLLKQYYDALAWDGEAWIRFPKTFWVLLDGGHRIPLLDYMAAKYPFLAKKLRAAELDPRLMLAASGTDDWLLLRKDRRFPKLFFHLVGRGEGVTAQVEGQSHSPYLEFIERAPRAGEVPGRAA